MFGQDDRVDAMHGDAVTESAASKLADMIANMPPEFRDYMMDLLMTMQDEAEPESPLKERDEPGPTPPFLKA